MLFCLLHSQGHRYVQSYHVFNTWLTRWTIRRWCVPLGWSTDVSSWRRLVAVTSRARPWSVRLWRGDAWKNQRTSFFSGTVKHAKEVVEHERELRATVSHPVAAGWDAQCVWCRVMISGHRRRGLADGEQRVACRPIRTKPMSTARYVPRELLGADSTNRRGPIPGQQTYPATGVTEGTYRVFSQ